MGTTYLNEGSFSTALKAGFDGLFHGAVVGAITGIAQGIVENHLTRKTTLKFSEALIDNLLTGQT